MVKRCFLSSLTKYTVRNYKLSFIALFLIIWTLLPLRFPNWLSYGLISISEMPNDLQRCPLEVSKSGEETCPLLIKELGVALKVQRLVNNSLLNSLENIVQAGGTWKPNSCRSPFRVAILVPYRNRTEQLKIFLQHIHPFLRNQNLDYQIFVIEQSAVHGFNRGKLFNIGFKEALKIRNFCCFIFHDVDLLPESPQHIYSCSKLPRHMCSAIDIFRYVLPYSTLFGGAVAISRQHFEVVNGFSNQFFGWGGEDDNLFNRFRKKGIDICRWERSVSHYTMLFHKKAVPNFNRYDLLDTDKSDEDGLSGLKYNVLDRELRPLYTWILTDVNPHDS